MGIIEITFWEYAVGRRQRRIGIALAWWITHMFFAQGGTILVPWGYNGWGTWQVPSVTNAVRIASGGFHNLAVLNDGSVVAWGDNGYGQCAVPDVVTGAVDVAAGLYHSLALLKDGRVVAWGDNSRGQCSVPPGVSNAVSIAAGSYHSLALLESGRVVAWGDNGSGQCDVPSGIGRVVALAAGENFSVALLADKRVVAWGAVRSEDFQTISNLTHVAAISAGQYYGVALHENGRLNVWGWNWCDLTTPSTGISDAVTIAAGNYHLLVQREDDSIEAFGCNYYGECTVPDAISNVLALSAGQHHSLALVWDGGSDVTPPEIFGVTSHVITASSPAGALVWFAVRARDDSDPLPRVQFSPPPGTLLGIGTHTVRVWAVDRWGNTNETQFTVAIVPDTTAPTLSGCMDKEVFVATTLWWRMTSLVSVVDDADPAPHVTYWPPLGSLLAEGQTTVVVQAWDASGNTNECAFQLRVASLPVWTWGQNAHGQCDVPPLATNVVGVAVGARHTLALCGDGRIIAWGDNSSGQCNVPPLSQGAVSVAAGYEFSVAVLEDGTVRAWGRNDYGVLDLPSSATSGVAVACGDHHVLLLREDGFVVAWGDNTWGQVTVPSELANVVKVAAGAQHSVALRAGGRVVAWGRNVEGQCDVPANLSNVVDVAAGDYFSVAFTRDGGVRVWGDRSGSSAVRQVPIRATNVIQVAAGSDFVIALRADGSLVVWGAGAQNAQLPAGITNVRTVASKKHHCAAIVRREYAWDSEPPIIFSCADRFWPATTPNGRVLTSLWRVRDNTDPCPHIDCPNLPLGSVVPVGVWTATIFTVDWLGNTNVCETVVHITPDTEPPIIGNCVDVTSVVWRINDARLTNEVSVSDNALPNHEILVQHVPPVGSPLRLGKNVATVVATDGWGNSSTCTFTVVQFQVPVVAWGFDGSGQCRVPPLVVDAVDLAAGQSHSVVLRADGTVVAWGDNTYGQCDVPEGVTGVVAVAAGNNHTLALLSSGQVVAWGQNYFGQCTVPPDLQNAVAIAAGANHSLALTADGRVVAWGDNMWGQCSVPDPLSDVVAIAAGGNNSAAVLADGSVVVWGITWYGLTQPPEDATNIVELKIGGNTALARTSDGCVLAWGDNSYGQCNVPLDLSNVVAIAASPYVSMAVSESGDIVSWGSWSASMREIPSGLQPVKKLVCGSNHALALLDDSPRVAVVRPSAFAVGAVTSIWVQFNVPIDPETVDVDDFLLFGSSGSLTVQSINAIRDFEFQVIPATTLTAEGLYTFEVGTNITDRGGRAVVVGYTGTFHLVASVPEPPTIEGFLPPPDVNLVRSLEFSIWNGWCLWLRGSRPDNTEVWLNGQRVAERGSGQWETVVTQLGEGERVLKLWAVGQHGQSSVTQQYNVLIDILPPSVQLEHPPAYSNGVPQFVYLHIHEGISGVDLGKSQYAVLRGGVSVPGTWDVDVDRAIFVPSSDFVEGPYDVSFRVVDCAGHTNEQVMRFVIDLTPPALPVVNPVVTPTTINQQWITGSREPDCAIICNGQQVVDFSSDTNWSWWTSLRSGSNVFVFKAVDRAGNESAPVAVSIFYDDIPPGPVSVTAMVAWTGTKIMLGWQHYDELANGGDIAWYSIYMSDQPFTHVSQATEIGVQYGGSKYFEVSGLQRGVTRYFAVVAQDVNGQIIPEVTSISASPVDVWPPPDPVNVRFQCGWTNIVMLWDVPPDPDGDLAGYRVYWAGDTNPYVLGVADTSFEVQDLPRNTGFPIRITSVDAYGNESVGVTNMAVTLLENPSELVAVPYDRMVDLSWNATQPTQYVARYDVYVDTAPFTSLGTRTAVVSTTGPYVSVDRLRNHQSYYFAVVAVNLSGGWDTNVTSVNAMPMPDTFGPSISNIFYNGVALSQALPIRRPGNFSAEAWDRAGVIRIEFFVNGQKLKSVQPWEAFWSVAETTSNGLYELVVKAYDSWNNETLYRTNVAVELDVPEPPVLQKPADNVAVNSRVVMLSGYACNWATAVTVYLNGCPVTEGGVVLDLNGMFGGWVELPVGTNTLEIEAVNRAGASSRTRATVIVDLSVPSAPIQLTATPRPDGVIQLVWASTVGAAGYNIYRATEPFSSTSQAEKINGSYAWGGTVYSDVTPADQTYYYRVAAVNRAGTEGPLSPPASAVSDRVAPYAEWIQYAPMGAYDEERGILGRGELRILVKFNEPLQSEPFFSLNAPGFQPINVALTRSSTNALLYSGSTVIGSWGVDGPVYAVLSARDVVGNRGTGIRTGGGHSCRHGGSCRVGLSVVAQCPGAGHIGCFTYRSSCG